MNNSGKYLKKTAGGLPKNSYDIVDLQLQKQTEKNILSFTLFAEMILFYHENV